MGTVSAHSDVCINCLIQYMWVLLMFEVLEENEWIDALCDRGLV